MWPENRLSAGEARRKFISPCALGVGKTRLTVVDPAFACATDPSSGVIEITNDFPDLGRRPAKDRAQASAIPLFSAKRPPGHETRNPIEFCR
jgi:hypothetical protein